jgi:hypothetical protein
MVRAGRGGVLYADEWISRLTRCEGFCQQPDGLGTPMDFAPIQQSRSVTPSGVAWPAYLEDFAALVFPIEIAIGSGIGTAIGMDQDGCHDRSRKRLTSRSHRTSPELESPLKPQTTGHCRHALELVVPVPALDRIRPWPATSPGTDHRIPHAADHRIIRKDDAAWRLRPISFAGNGRRRCALWGVKIAVAQARSPAGEVPPAAQKGQKLLSCQYSSRRDSCSLTIVS